VVAGVVAVCAPVATGVLAGVMVEAAGAGVTVLPPVTASSARAANGITARPVTNKPAVAKLRTRFMEESFPSGDRLLLPTDSDITTRLRHGGASGMAEFWHDSEIR
jgi:hypothetical protein